MIANDTIILLILTLITLALIFWLIRTEIRLKKFFAGKNAASLETEIQNLINELKILKQSNKQIETEIIQIESRLKKSIRGLSTVRFNPFTDSSGNQSFAIAMLSEEGNGLVLSSLYARDRMSVFAKPIKKYTSEFELTEEEKQALEKAKIA